MVTTERNQCAESLPEEKREGAFAWEWRVMAVSAFWALPGVLFGVLARLLIPDGGPVSWWVAGGALFTAALGGMLEAGHFTE